MSEQIKIAAFEAENVKRIKLVELTPTQNGLEIIGGKNRQGKTSILDAITWALAGNRYKPTNAKRDESVLDPHIKVTLTNGFIVERAGDKLKVTDSEGQKGSQSILNEVIEKLALDLPQFIESTSPEKARTLLDIIGVGDELHKLEVAEKKLFDERTLTGKIKRSKEQLLEDMTYYEDSPVDLISASDIIQQQQAVLQLNAENARKRSQVEQIAAQGKQKAAEVESINEQLKTLMERIDDLQQRKADMQAEVATLKSDYKIATTEVSTLVDADTTQLETQLEEIESINDKVRTNQSYKVAADEVESFKTQYSDLEEEINDIRAQKMALLEGADLPLPGLNVEDGELIYEGKAWDSMSGSDQLKVSTAIVRKLNPSMGFVLVDKLEQLDADTLREFGEWAVAEGLQIIGTRVSTGDECSVIIEDGEVLSTSKPAVVEAVAPKAWSGEEW